MSAAPVANPNCPACAAAKNDPAWRPDNRITIALMSIMAVLTMITFVRVVQTRAQENAAITRAAEVVATEPAR